MSWIKRQICLSNIASLNLHRSLNHNPPSAFGIQRTSHFFQWIFLLSPIYPRQNFQIRISISWQRSTGKRKQLIAKMGMAWTIAFKKTFFPACDGNFSLQPCNLPQTLFFFLFRLAFFFLPPPPKLQETPNTSHIP